MSRDVTVAVVGMRFGAEFVPIYRHHPDVARVTICDKDPAALAEAGERFDIADRRDNLEAVLADPAIDAVHLVTARTMRSSRGTYCWPGSTAPARCRWPPAWPMSRL